MTLPSQNAGESLVERIRKARPFELVYLDVEVRRGAWSFANDFGYWYGLKPEHLRALPGFGTDPAVTGLLSFHPSGYVREVAVAVLASIDTGRELPFLLVRLDDWVSEVRSSARLVLRKRLDNRHLAAWIYVLPLLLRLKKRHRFLDESLVDDALALIRQAVAEGTDTGLALPDTESRRWWAAAMYDSATTDETVRHVTERLLSHPDNQIRHAAAKRLRESNWLAKNVGLLDRLLRDKSPTVRREAAAFLAEQSAADVTPILVERLLLDRSAHVRRIAQEQLSARAQIDPATIYRDALRSPEGNMTTALRGLAETGGERDAALVLPYWDDERPGVQRAAVAARGRLSDDPDPAPLLEKLASPLPGVSREAEKALEPRIYSVSVRGLTDLFETTELLHVRVNTLRLFARLGKWRSLAPIIRALSPKFGSEINDRARTLLSRWIAQYNVDWSVPRAEDLDALETMLKGQPEVPWRTYLQSVLTEWRGRIGA